MKRGRSDSDRFIVRQGTKGWMVWDRKRKGPALIGTKLAERLTKAEAERLKIELASMDDD